MIGFIIILESISHLILMKVIFMALLVAIQRQDHIQMILKRPKQYQTLARAIVDYVVMMIRA